MNKILTAITFLLFACATCFGQSSFKGLTPGKSSRVDVERVLGRPVNKVSETLIEYRPQPLTSKVFVQYRKNSLVVERVEVFCRTENSTCDDFIRSLNLKLELHKDDDTAEVDDKKWKDLYGSPLFIVTSGDLADVTGDSFVTARVAFYSRELYEAEFSRVKATIAKIEEDLKKPPVPEPGQITGIVALNGNPVAGAMIDLYRTDGYGSLQAKTDRYGIFRLTGLRGSYVVVVSGPAMKWTYVNGLNIPVAAALEIVAEPGDGARPTQEQVMATIR